MRFGEVCARVNHLGIEKERVKIVGKIVVIVDVLAVGFLAAVPAGLVAVNVFERPRLAARNQQKLRGSLEQELLVEGLEKVLGADARPLRHQVEYRAVAQVQSSGHQEIEQGVYFRPPDQGGNGAFIGDREG
jgi:hypothetical protein